MKNARVVDRREARTKHAVLTAFTSLIAERRYAEIDMGEIAERANVGRSTLYRHYRSKGELFRMSMEWIVSALADAVTSSDASPTLVATVEHLWAGRRLGRSVFSQPELIKDIRRSLVTALESRLAAQGAPPSLASFRSVQIAGAQLALLEAWLSGAIGASRDQVVDGLLSATKI